MVEAVVSFVVDKLANVIENEIKFLGGVGEKFKRVQHELIQIQCCLKDANKKRKNEGVLNWLNSLRDVAYDIEDTTDTFFLKVNCQKCSNFSQKLKKLCNKPVELYWLHKLGTKLDEIQQTLDHIFQSREKYGIQFEHDKSEEETVKMPLRRTTYQEVDENKAEVVGLNDDKNKILNLLRSQEIARRAVITIVGPGGLGKTTLAHMVYKSARAEFKYHVMLSVSQQFSLTDILTKMLRGLQESKQNNKEVEDLDNDDRSSNEYVPKNVDVGYLTHKLQSLLSSERYLIILDDVWKVELWSQLTYALPDIQNGSRILMTSRFTNVALSADPTMLPYKLDYLNDESSRDLLLKKAFPYKKPCEESLTELLELADKLSKTCKGLPLALIVLGGILSTKDPSYDAWEIVFRTMDWHIDGKGCIDVLAMSYQDMPYHLKPCFIYLASFPEDYEISAKSLIRMWVAEGFIPHEGRKTMEELAEDYLEELFQRSMVEVTSRSIYGSMIKCCKVHDLLRDLAMHEARQENFVTVFSGGLDVNHNQPKRRIRRASLQTDTRQVMEYVGSNARSLFWFSKYRKLFPKCSNFRLLKVIELVGVVIDIRNLEGFIHLKYLGIRGSTILNFPCSVHRIRGLETVDVRGNLHSGFSLNNLWTISTLRHVRCDLGYGSLSVLDGPQSTDDLRNLQTMGWIKPMRTWRDRNTLPPLNDLRKLRVTKCNEDWVTVTTLLETLHSLISLRIKGDDLPKEIIYPTTLPNYDNLRSLFLYGQWSPNISLEASFFPPRLVELGLFGSKLKPDIMLELGKLNNLKKLCLGDHVFDAVCTELLCQAGFPVLQYLKVDDYLVYNLRVGKGAMPKLLYLDVSKHTDLALPRELQNVTISHGKRENAEAVVRFVLGKLADFIAQEAQFLGVAGKKAERVHHKLTQMHCFMRDADLKGKRDERIRHCLHELRDVAHRIEDAIDTFFLRVENHRVKDPSFLQILKKSYNKPSKMHILNLDTELDWSQQMLQEISECRILLGLRNIDVQDNSHG